MENLDQGSIFGGLRSDKYPGMECYGIILTASCDIAQSKVPKLYFVTAIDVIEWGCMHDTYLNTYKTNIENAKNAYYDLTNQYNLSPELLETYERDVVIQILENEITKKSKRDDLMKKYDAYMLIKTGISDSTKIREVIKQDAKPIKKLLEKIIKGEMNHYHFVPLSAYTDQANADGGLIVDFQEINWLSFEDARNIINPGIDNLIIDYYTKDQQELYKKIFWLEKEDAFVPHVGHIKSPWREHLMQRFSHCFARIGLPDITEEDHTKIVNRMTEGI